MIDVKHIQTLLHKIKNKKEGRTQLFLELKKFFESDERKDEDRSVFLSVTDDKGDTVLHCVLGYGGTVEFATALLNAGADPFVMNKKSETAFEQLIKKEEYALVATLVKSGVRSVVQWRAILEQFGQLPLPLHKKKAAEYQDVLRNIRACIVAESQDLRWLLTVIKEEPSLREECFTRMEAIFLKFKSENQKNKLHEFWYIKNTEGEPILHIAIQYGARKLVEILLASHTYAFQINSNNISAFYLLVQHHYYDLALQYVNQGHAGGLFMRNVQQETVVYQICKLPIPDKLTDQKQFSDLMHALFKIVCTSHSAPDIEFLGPASLMQVNACWHSLFRSVGVLELKVSGHKGDSEQALQKIERQFFKCYALSDAIALADYLRENNFSYEEQLKIFLSRNDKFVSKKQNKKITLELRLMFLNLLGVLKNSLQDILRTPEEYHQAEQWLTQLDLEAWILAKYSQQCREEVFLEVRPSRIQFGTVSPSSPDVLATVILPEDVKKQCLI